MFAICCYKKFDLEMNRVFVVSETKVTTKTLSRHLYEYRTILSQSAYSDYPMSYCSVCVYKFAIYADRGGWEPG